MDPKRRAIVIVVDGLGVGALPDAAQYGDEGSNTLANTAKAVGGLRVPNLQRWGLGNIEPLLGVDPVETPEASFGRMAELSAGKDSTSGHWELMGCPVEAPFPTYPDGFPPEVVRVVTEVAGVPPLGNVVASGTEIIEELGEEHLRTGRPILYTSADSVLQLAVHTKVWPVEKLHGVCAAIRARLEPPHQVARVIARPFFGEPGKFVRAQERKDFTVPPPRATALDVVSAHGLPVVGIGKIGDLFGGKGLTASHPSKGLDICLDELLSVLSTVDQGLILTNLGEFDTLWGHRNDPQGFANGLSQFDQWLPDLERVIRAGLDLVVITGDHGCDPTTPSTDHSREFVPLLVWTGASGVSLGQRATFADVGATLLDFLGLQGDVAGQSFLGTLPFAPSPPAPEPEPEVAAVSQEPLVERGEEILQLVREIQEDLSYAANLFYTVLRQEAGIAPETLVALRAREQEEMTFVGLLMVAEGLLTHDSLTELMNLCLARWLDQAGRLEGEIRRFFEARDRAKFWGETLVDEGLLSEEELASFYVKACGIPYLQLSGYRVPREAAAALSREAAVATGVLPIAKEGNVLTVATHRPVDAHLMDEVIALSGCKVRPVLAMRDQLLDALGRVYLQPAEEEAPPAPPARPPEPLAPQAEVVEPAAPDGSDLSWLLSAARIMTRYAYAPHSGLHVGAAVLCEDGRVFTGCNVENDSYGLSMCAERVAVFKAVSSGCRVVKAVAVVAEGMAGIRPCGACLQVVRQFGQGAVFVFEKPGGGMESYTLEELLPQAFSLPTGA